jgi:hypothetical protein
MLNKNIINYTKLFLIYSQVVVQAILINLILFFLGKTLGGFSEFLTTPRGQLVNLASIITSTIIFPLIGLISFVFFVKMTEQSLKWFRLAGYIFIVIMIGGPLGLENSTISDKLILEIMHLVVGVQFIELIAYFYTKIVSKPAIMESKKRTTISL